jgi:hypothetical protein
MSRQRHPLSYVARLIFIVTVTVLVSSAAHGQANRNPASFREFLLQYKGREVLVIDRTGGQEQFTSGESSKAYLLLLRDVQNDYFVVSRNVENDKRTFAYPMTVIRRIIFQYDNKPYQQIVIEMY